MSQARQQIRAPVGLELIEERRRSYGRHLRTEQLELLRKAARTPARRRLR